MAGRTQCVVVFLLVVTGKDETCLAEAVLFVSGHDFLYGQRYFRADSCGCLQVGAVLIVNKLL